MVVCGKCKHFKLYFLASSVFEFKLEFEAWVKVSDGLDMVRVSNESWGFKLRFELGLGFE